MITYKITPSRPEAHIFHIEIEIESPEPNGQIMSLPAWIPGSYMIRDFAKNIVTIAARCGSAAIELTKIDKQTWQCEPCSGALCIAYDVYAWDLSVRGAHLDTTHGYFNGTSVFLSIHGKKQDKCVVILDPPSGKNYADWRVATTLQSDGADALAFGRYKAQNYYELIDHPVEMGHFTHGAFEVAGTQHEIAITGKHSTDMNRLCADLKQICEAQIKMIGEFPAMKRYLFLVMAVGEGYGGLEHKTSTSLICKRSDLPRPGKVDVTEGYRQFLGLCSHEYFHLWNVKRITPKRFQNADLSTEAYSRLLWAFEGITSYYDDLMLVRSERITEESYLELLAQLITRVIRTPGRFKQSVSDSSFDAWTKFYKQDENAPNSIISYYSKGALIAICLDLMIRQKTSGLKSLDHVMQRLWNDFGSREVGVDEEDIERIIQHETGLDLSRFFDQAIRGTEELPLQDLLRTVGVGFNLRQATNGEDKGGVRNDSGKRVEAKPALGVQFKADGKDAQLSVVLDDGAAQNAGLAAGDVIIAINGIRATPMNVSSLIEQMSVTESSLLHVFRRDELMIFDVIAQQSKPDTCELWMMDDMPEDVLAARSSWLSQTAYG
jgi:predicted metalloprotease with PDZ domain